MRRITSRRPGHRAAAEDEHLRRGEVRGHGHIVRVAQVQRLHDLLILPGVAVIRIGEQQHQIDLVIGDPGVDLLVTALIVGKIQRHGRPVASATRRPVVAVAERLCLLSTLL